jgi:predicted dehydrogenase
LEKKVQWGVLGAAKIALKKVIPAMRQAESSQVAALASRDIGKARQAAEQLGIPKAFGTYEELLADPEIEVVYIPLPNHLHVPWAVKAAEAGKHVLCEKPLGLTAQEAGKLLEVRNRTGVKIEEALMVRSHPQWIGVLELIKAGRIGTVCSVSGVFSYNNRDPKNIRNIADFGGGALMDIGCYLIYISRLIFAQEPKRVLGVIVEDPETRTDVVTSGILDFAMGQSIFTCSTRMVPYQRIQIFGTAGRIEVEIPFNAPPDSACRIFVDSGTDLSGRSSEVIEFPVSDQYTIQSELFSKSVREGTPLPVALEGSVQNMAVIDALFRSAKSGRWEQP